MSHNDSNERERRNDHEGQERRDNATPGVIGGAALIGAGIGALISGPLVAIGLGATAAGLCLSDNKAGDVARSTGRAGLAVVDKGKELNERYRVSDKVKGAAHTTYEKAKEVDAEHHIVDKAKSGASRAWQRVRDMDREHRLTARAGEAVGKTMDGVAHALSKEDKSEGKESTNERK